MTELRTAVVSGAARGIGKAIAVQLARDGFAVVMADIADREHAEESIQAVVASGNPAIYVKGDIASDAGRRQILETTLETFGRIDVLVNNAGVAPKTRMDLLQTTEESMDFVLGVNLKGTFFLTQLTANVMISHIRDYGAQKPVIVNISSVSAYASSTQRGEYCISKAGVSMITALFADRLAEYGICVFEVRPGIIMTDMTSVVKEKYDKLIEGGLTPIKRWGYPEDVAKAVSLLCSGQLAFSTGEIINVDGGFHVRRL